ncbi:MAG: phosphoglycerate dehydrogenase [Chloroflexota bacterium]|nr:phosphoglycerate dehydrogenase [Chloroflexota bacterium]
MATILVSVARASEQGVGGPLGPLHEAGHEVRHVPADAQTSARELISALEDCSSVVANIERYTREVFEGAPQLRHIARVGVGYDAVDIASATAHGVLVTNTPGANASAVADFAIGMLLAVARHIPTFDGDVRRGGWQSRIGADVWQQTLGIVGLGNIGRGVARRARGFDMRVLAREPYPDEAFVREVGVELVSLEQVFAESDFVTLHLPASAETARMVDARLLGLMKPTAYLINTARGALVDEDALYAALQQRTIAGAALDVRESEPPRDPRFNELDNVVLSPHAAGSTPRAVNTAIRRAAEAVVAYLRGEPPDGVINPDVLAARPAGTSDRR